MKLFRACFRDNLNSLEICLRFVESHSDFRALFHDKFDWPEGLSHQSLITLAIRGKHLISVKKVVADLSSVLEQSSGIRDYWRPRTKRCRTVSYNKLLGWVIYQRLNCPCRFRKEVIP